MGALMLLTTVAALASAGPGGSAPAGDQACAALARTPPEGVAVTSAEAITPAPSWSAPHQHFYNGKTSTPFCRVQGRIDGRIGFELWLPQNAAWNGRFLGAGVGGDAGVFNYTDLARGVDAGYASATTDTGHKDDDAHWMMDPVKVEDYAERAEHRLAEAAQAITARYYARAPRSYFLGCSGGGRQALKEAQVYPQDYQGVVAGAPGPRMPTLSARMTWTGLYLKSHPETTITDADWALVAQGAVKACDLNDGVADGVVERPDRCRFDLSSLACKPGQAGDCLAADKLAMIRTITSPLHDETGRTFDPGMFPGVRSRPGPPSPLVREFFAEGVHHDPAWTEEGFKLGAETALAYRTLPHMAADDARLTGFAARGDKLILYQGWLDPSVLAYQILDYQAALERAPGGPQATRDFERLFMVPGMYHCGGGPGATELGGAADALPIGDADHDLLAAVVAWVERGRAPERVVASKLEEGHVTGQHPICAYPAEAVYKGGPPREAASYACRRRTQAAL